MTGKVKNGKRMAGGKNLVLTGVMLAQETLSALGVPGASLLEKGVNAVYEKRRAAALDILIEAIKREGIVNLQFEEGEADDLVQMMMRFAKATEEGTARQNLKLLAQVIFGLKRNRAFEFDKFQACANVLETLTRDEILFLGRMYRFYTDNPGKNDYRAFLKSLSGTFENLQAEALAAGLTRTGVLLPISAFGTINYAPAPRLYEICQLAQIDHPLT